jgi:hypothetical protein
MRDTFSTDLAGAQHFAIAEDGYPTGEQYDPSDDYPTVVECPCCGGPGVELGTLGRLEWFRCRDCGMDFQRHEAEVAADQDNEARSN